MFKEHREAFFKRFSEAMGKEKAIVLLKGKHEVPVDNTDIEYEVQQESYFKYLFGVKETEFYGIMEMDTGKAVLFAPEISELYKIWMTVLSNEEISEKYDIPVKSLAQIEEYITAYQPVGEK